MDEEIKQEFEKVWKKLRGLEEGLIPLPKKEIKKEGKKSYSGLTGGIKLLINENFLGTPKSVKEIFDELKRQGYHYPKKSVFKLLSIDFMKNKRIITRIRENNKWMYVIRK